MPRPEPRSEACGHAGLVLLQLAAARAEIGPFAREARETPQVAARLYRVAAGRPPRPLVRVA